MMFIETVNAQYAYRFGFVNLSGSVSVYNFTFDAYKICGRTPKGYYVNYYGDPKWCSNTARKRFAYPSIELAWESLLARMRVHQAILAGRLQSVEGGLDFIRDNSLKPEEVIESDKWKFAL
jgi:hypothetical protein